jgi:serine acetyltransferase
VDGARRATVLRGVSIGDSETVGAAAVVTKDVAAGTTVVGVQAFSSRAKPAFVPVARRAEASQRAPWA